MGRAGALAFTRTPRQGEDSFEKSGERCEVIFRVMRADDFSGSSSQLLNFSIGLRANKTYRIARFGKVVPRVNKLRPQSARVKVGAAVNGGHDWQHALIHGFEDRNRHAFRIAEQNKKVPLAQSFPIQRAGAASVKNTRRSFANFSLSSLPMALRRGIPCDNSSRTGSTHR